MVPSPDDVLLLVRPVLRCGRCRVVLVRSALTLGALLDRVADHIITEHCGGGREAGWPAGQWRATPCPGVRPIAHRADDGSTPRITEFDLFCGEGLFCGISPCSYRLARPHATVAQLLDRVALHVRERHSGRPRSLRELRAVHGMPTGLPVIHRSW